MDSGERRAAPTPMHACHLRRSQHRPRVTPPPATQDGTRRCPTAGRAAAPGPPIAACRNPRALAPTQPPPPPRCQTLGLDMLAIAG